jgi:hypothetical protein
MFKILSNLKHRVGANASCCDELCYYRIKNRTQTIGISLLVILVLPYSLSSNSLTPDVRPTSIQPEKQSLQNLMIRTSTGLYDVDIPSINNIAESVSPASENNTTCPSLIDVDPGSTAYNSQNIECVQQLFNSCTRSDFLLVYGLGSVHVSIKGKNNDSLCSIEFRQETEMGKSNLHSCLIPLDKIATWSSWKNADGVTALDGILSFCNNIA